MDNLHPVQKISSRTLIFNYVHPSTISTRTAPRTSNPNSNMEIAQTMTNLNDGFSVSGGSKTPKKDYMGSCHPPTRPPKSPPLETQNPPITGKLSNPPPVTQGYDLGKKYPNCPPDKNTRVLTMRIVLKMKVFYQLHLLTIELWQKNDQERQLTSKKIPTMCVFREKQ